MIPRLRTKLTALQEQCESQQAKLKVVREKHAKFMPELKQLLVDMDVDVASSSESADDSDDSE